MFVIQVRVNSKHRDYHYTHWTIYPDRFVYNELGDLPADNSDRVPVPREFYCTDAENTIAKFVHFTVTHIATCNIHSCIELLIIWSITTSYCFIRH